jgi:thiamine-monophosphate kinase
VPRGTALLRTGGCAGDVLAVTGTLGDAAAGLALATGELHARDESAARELAARFEYPTPRVELGIAARGLATAAMDLSDGLAGDLPKLAAASRLGARIELERLPVSRALESVVAADRARAYALGGGEDYELLVAVPPPAFDALAAEARRLNLTLTAIGELRRENAITWSLDGKELSPPGRGYDHFR